MGTLAPIAFRTESSARTLRNRTQEADALR
jgi:hypothetical protein